MLERRLAFFALLLPTISLAHAPRRMDSGVIVLQQGLSIIAPAVLLLAAAWLCGRKVRLALALALALALTLIPTLALVLTLTLTLILTIPLPLRYASPWGG